MTFNLPGSLYHTEAQRIGSQVAEHVARAVTTMIEFEAEWAISVDSDGAGDTRTPSDAEPEPASALDNRDLSRAPAVTITEADHAPAALHAAVAAGGWAPPLQRAR
jgi:hypothetical protein